MAESLLDFFMLSQGVSTDSRSILPGEIYFALKGETFDGNKFAEQALHKGAKVAVVDDSAVYRENGRYIVVENVLTSLQDLALTYRLKFNIPVIAITGTNGKTTSKELLSNVLSQSFNVLSTSGNFNNHIGVPLTLLKLRETHEIAIIEMGASGPGEIENLCEIARPTHGFITNIGKAHLQGFGSIGQIMRSKGELFAYLENNGGTIFLAETLKRFEYFAAAKYTNPHEYLAEDMEGKQISSVDLQPSFPYIKIKVNNKAGDNYLIQSKLYGSYNFPNILSVLKIADYFELSPQQIAKGIQSYVPANNRSQIVEDSNGNVIVMDAYNANPSSVDAALSSFLAINDNRQKLIILGDMLELGTDEDKEHQIVVRRLLTQKQVACIFVGKIFKKQSERIEPYDKTDIKFFKNASETRKWWKEAKLQKMIILVKASRGIALEQVFN